MDESNHISWKKKKNLLFYLQKKRKWSNKTDYITA